MDADLICRVVLGFVFAVAAAGKARSSNDFADSLTSLGIRRYTRPTAFAVIAAEVICVVLLAVPSTARWGHALALALLVAFSAGIALTVRSRAVVACRCFGSNGRQLGVSHLIRNGFLAIVAIIGLASGQLPGSVPRLVIALGAGAFLSLLFIRWDDLTYLFTGA